MVKCIFRGDQIRGIRGIRDNKSTPIDPELHECPTDVDAQSSFNLKGVRILIIWAQEPNRYLLLGCLVKRSFNIDEEQ